MIIHLTTISLAFLLPLVNYPLGKVFLSTIILLPAHWIIDASKAEISHLLKPQPDKKFFWILIGLDQILHITILYLIFNFLVIK